MRFRSKMATASERDRVPKRHRLRAVASYIGPYWEHIADHLLLESSCERTIERIRRDYKFSQDQAFQMLCTWSEMFHTEATEEKLCLALLSEEC